MNVRGPLDPGIEHSVDRLRGVPSLTGRSASRGREGAVAAAPGSFARVLAETVAGLRISEHARQRLCSAGMGAHDLEAVGRAVEKLAAHGGRESLVMYKDAAFLVSVRNRTLITVVPAHRMREQIFTNIDSAAFVSSEDNSSGAGPAWEATGERRA
ncbi:MAG: flagellar protein [Bacillota bacterium]